MRPISRRLALINWLSVITLAQVAKPQQTPTNPPPDERFKADILVIAPHPDDESTIAGYLAKAVLDEHRRVAVVVTTRGDAGQNLVGYEQARSLAEIREMETRQALASIGITNVFFLRAPDTLGAGCLRRIALARDVEPRQLTRRGGAIHQTDPPGSGDHHVARYSRWRKP